MRKYIIHFVNQVIKRGESEYYTEFKELIPFGFRYTWAFSSPNLLIINVESNFEAKKKEENKEVKNIANINTWDRDKYEIYRVAM